MKTSLSSFCKQHKLPKSSVHRRCGELQIDTTQGLSQDDQQRLLAEFEVVKAADAIVEVGNHQTVLPSPTTPHSYTLESLRTTDSVRFENPLDIANQFLQVADQLQSAMQQDIETRESQLTQTKQAKKAVAEKADELKLEARLYQLQTELLDKAQTAETKDLKDLLGNLNSLGKPQSSQSSDS